jgi:hypothetical protein
LSIKKKKKKKKKKKPKPPHAIAKLHLSKIIQNKIPKLLGFLLHLLQGNLFQFSQSQIPDQSKYSEIMKLNSEVMKTQEKQHGPNHIIVNSCATLQVFKFINFYSTGS